MTTPLPLATPATKTPATKTPAIKTPNQNEQLYIFGYGSLTWRPSPDLINCKSYRGILREGGGENRYKFVRSWSQRSTDHRGCDESFPGVVCNLLTECEILGFYETWFDDEKDKDF